MKGRQGVPAKKAKEKKGTDNFSYDLDRPSRSEILAAAFRQIHKDLEEVRKLTHNA